MNKLKNNLLRLFLTITSGVLALSLTGMTAFALPTVTITSPTSNQQLASGSVLTVTGTAGVNESVQVLFDGTLVAVVTADGSGNWSTTLHNISAAHHTVQAKVTQNEQVFMATTDMGAGTSSMQVLDTTNNSMNTLSNFPISLGSNLVAGSAVSPDNTVAYVGGYQFNPGYLVKINLSTGAVSQVSGVAAGSKISIGSFSPDGTKYYAPNMAGGSESVYVIDVATNAVTSTITLNAGKTYNIASLIGGKVFVNGPDDRIYVINPVDDSMTNFTPSCGPAVLIAPDNNDATSYWVTCASGTIQKLAVADNSLEENIATSNPGVPYVIHPVGSNKLFVSNAQATSDVEVYDTTNGSLLDTITLPKEAWTLTASSDGSKVFAPMAGSTFDGTDVAVINVADDTFQTVTTGGASLNAVLIPAQSAEANVDFSVVSATGGGTQQNDSNSSELAGTGENTMALVSIATAITFAGFLILTMMKRYGSKNY